MSNLQKQYQLIQEIHQLLPQVCVKNNIEKIEVTGDWQIHPQKGLFLATEKMEVMDKENWQKFLDECCLAIQTPQIRQILVGLNDVLKNIEIQGYHTNHYLEMVDTYVKNDYLFNKLLKNLFPKSQAEALDDKWFRPIKKDGKYTGQSLFDQNPEQVLTELVVILENLLK